MAGKRAKIAPLRVQDDALSPSASSEQEGTGHPAPPLPADSGSWFARTWHYLFLAHLLDHPNEIVTFSQASHSVTVRLSSGHEYCLDKGRL